MLLVVTIALGLNDISVKSEGVSVVEVPELVNKLIHHHIVVELVVLHDIGFVFDDFVKSKAIRKAEVGINVDIDLLSLHVLHQLVNFDLVTLDFFLDGSFLSAHVPDEVAHFNVLEV